MKTANEKNMLGVLDALDERLKLCDDAEIRLYALSHSTVMAMFDDIDRQSVAAHGPSVRVALAHLMELLCEKEASNHTSDPDGSRQEKGLEQRIPVSSV